MTNVYSKVKQNYQSAENLMLCATKAYLSCATKAYLCCAFMSWAGLDSLDALTPTKITLIDKKASDEQKTKFIDEVLGKFVEKFPFVEFDIEKAWREQQEQRNSASLTVTPNLAPGTYTCNHGLLAFVNAQIEVLHSSHIGWQDNENYLH